MATARKTTKASIGETKTVMEWLAEIKLYKQKIAKVESRLRETPLFYITSNVTKDAEKEKETLERAKALLQQYNDLNSNLETIKKALLVFNATTEISIGEKKITLARAIELYKSNKVISFLSGLYAANLAAIKNKEIELAKVQKLEVDSLESKLLGGTGANKSNSNLQSQIDRRRDEYSIYKVEAINLAQEYDKIINDDIAFKQHINTQINLVNATNTLTIDLANKATDLL